MYMSNMSSMSSMSSMSEHIKPTSSKRKKRNKNNMNLTKIKQLEQENKELKYKIEIYKTKINKIKNIGDEFKKKLNFIIEFINIIKTHEKFDNYDIAIIGSLTRQIFELPYALSELFSLETFGDPRNRDIDVVIHNRDFIQIDKKDKIKEFIKDIMNALNIYLNIFNTFETSKIFTPRIGDYTLKRIENVTIQTCDDNSVSGKKALLLIPHYKLYFCDDQEKVLTVDLMGWVPKNELEWSNVDFNVNMLALTEDGICTRHQNQYCNIFGILDSISKKEAIPCVDLEKYHNEAWDYPIPRDAKVLPLAQIIYFLTLRTKILDSGYKIIPYIKFPVLVLEKTEECNFSMCKPPFISVKLECGHKISLMAYSGIIFKGKNENSEAILCPFCRKDLKLSFMIQSIEQKEFWFSNLSKIFKENNFSPKKYVTRSSIGEEPMNYILEMYNNTDQSTSVSSDSQQIFSPSLSLNSIS